jgi:hypothetical protein
MQRDKKQGNSIGWYTMQTKFNNNLGYLVEQLKPKSAAPILHAEVKRTSNFAHIQFSLCPASISPNVMEVIRGMWGQAVA